LGSNFANLVHEGFLGFLLTPIKPFPSQLFKFLSCTEASVGHAGASGYLAAMALFGLAPATMKPIALILNILVAAIASYKYLKVGRFSWQLFWPFAITSIPCAYWGGLILLPNH